MRVLYLTTGATVHDRRFMAAYASRGHEVAYLRLVPEPTTPAGFLPDGVIELSWPEFGGPVDGVATGLEALIAPLCGAIASHGGGLVHAGPLPTAAWLAARAGAPRLVSMSWGSDVLLEAQLDAAVAGRVNEAVTASDLIQCDCGHTAEVLAAHHGADPACVVVFPWGVDTAQFSPRPRANRSWPSDPEAVVVTTFRSWEPVYGVETAVRAFSRAAQRDPHLYLLLGGAGSLAPQIEQAILESDALARIKRFGSTENAEIGKLLAESDVYLSASLSDGTSISLLEAMATGLPVVITDIPCNREWVDAGDGGYLAPAGDSASFADALLALACDAEARARMGERNRREAECRAEWNENVGMLFAALSQLPTARVNE
jgi:L-malate glycosyltransferase